MRPATSDKSFAQEVARDDYTPNVADTAARVTEYYLNQALDRQNMVNTVMLNSTRGQYEKTVGRVGEELDRRLARAQGSLNAAAGGVILGSDDFQSAVRRCVSEMAEEGLTGFYDRAGREWSAQAYVTMDVRTTAANAAREAAMERNREYGNELIAVSSHPGARPLCEPYQGGVYSTDGSTGETTDLHGATISYYPLELTSYGEAAGLFGINCGHYPSPFIAGLSVVRKLDISHEENERLYRESQQQRYMERKIRAQKTKADALAAAGDAAGAKAARMRAREMNKELKGWCAEKGRAYYPERVRVTRGEKADVAKDLSVRDLVTLARAEQRTTPTIPEYTPTPVMACADHQALTDYMRTNYNVIVDGEVGKLRFEDVKRTVSGIETVLQRFPGLSRHLEFIGTDSKDHWGVMGTARTHIYFSPDYYKNNPVSAMKLATQIKLKSGREWIRNSSVETIGMHEAGHVLESLLISINPAYDTPEARRLAWAGHIEAERIVLLAFQNLGIPNDADAVLTTLSDISGNATRDPGEAFADAIADYARNGNSSRLLSKEIVRIAEGIIKERGNRL